MKPSTEFQKMDTTHSNKSFFHVYNSANQYRNLRDARIGHLAVFQNHLLVYSCDGCKSVSGIAAALDVPACSILFVAFGRICSLDQLRPAGIDRDVAAGKIVPPVGWLAVFSDGPREALNDWKPIVSQLNPSISALIQTTRPSASLRSSDDEKAQKNVSLLEVSFLRRDAERAVRATNTRLAEANAIHRLLLDISEKIYASGLVADLRRIDTSDMPGNLADVVEISLAQCEIDRYDAQERARDACDKLASYATTEHMLAEE